MSIEFRSEPIKIKVLDSRNHMSEHRVERRFDPLTHQSSLICPGLKDKWVGFYANRDEEWLKQITKESKHGCPFCKPTIDNIAARFPEDQVPGGILKREGLYVFPNIFPRTEFEAVVTCPEIHYLSLNQFTNGLVNDFLLAALECVRTVYNSNKTLSYAVIGTNYLPPAGASLIHFHQQIAMQHTPFNRVRNLIESSTKYAEEKASNFWQDLIEINEVRQIRQVGNVYWYVPFAPNGFCEVRASVNACHFLELEGNDVMEIAAGLSNILEYYGDRGFDSFNCVVYSGAIGARDDFRIGLSVVARPNVRSNYLSIDSWFMPFLLGETVVQENPEDLALDIRNYFQKCYSE